MGKGRLEAFSDGVIAIIITIMVLELKVPHGTDLDALRPLCATLLGYLVSFVYVAIYWNNHHHMLHLANRVTGSVMWANMHLLFWLSLIPFATAWFGENHEAATPTALYGVVLFMCGLAWLILQRALLRIHGHDSPLAAAVGSDAKGKLSAVIYIAAIGLAFVQHWISVGCYIGVAILWFVPDRRFERASHAAHPLHASPERAEPR
jgi:uncharacterized membrane protein